VSFMRYLPEFIVVGHIARFPSGVKVGKLD
jgi:hypothetical protein